MATAGLAIGIGNVWRFPYMMGSHGGSAFLVLFVACVVFLSLPALMAEWALAWGIGRAETVKQVFGAEYKLLSSVYFFWIKWAAPAILIIVLSGTLYEAITG